MPNIPPDPYHHWFQAAKQGDIASLKQLLQSGMNINHIDSQKNTALHHAVIHAQLETITFLIAHQASLDLQNKDEATPLHLTEKNMDSIRLLLEAGANPNIKDKDWDYPYYFAFYGSMPRELIELYIKHGANLVLHT